MSNPQNYYVTRRRRFLWEFDFVARSARSVLERYFGENAGMLLAEARREFENLIPQLPDVGGKQPFTEFVVFSGMLLAIYRISKAHGKTVEQVGEMIFEIGREFLKSFPPFLLRLFMPVNFSKRYVERLRKRAAETHAREYPEGYVLNFVEGNGKRQYRITCYRY